MWYDSDDASSAMLLDEVVDVWARGEHTFVAFHLYLEDDNEDWWEHKSILGDLLELREQIIRGDLRCLYMAWLNEAAQSVCFDEDDLPVPAGLGELNAALERFAFVFVLDPDVIAAAATHSEPLGARE